MALPGCTDLPEVLGGQRLKVRLRRSLLRPVEQRFRGARCPPTSEGPNQDVSQALNYCQAPTGTRQGTIANWRCRPVFVTPMMARGACRLGVFALMTDEGECGENRLVRCAAKRSPELQQEGRRALRRSKESPIEWEQLKSTSNMT
jgi:hypothetical protein